MFNIIRVLCLDRFAHPSTLFLDSFLRRFNSFFGMVGIGIIYHFCIMLLVKISHGSVSDYLLLIRGSFFGEAYKLSNIFSIFDFLLIE